MATGVKQPGTEIVGRISLLMKALKNVYNQLQYMNACTVQVFIPIYIDC